MDGHVNLGSYAPTPVVSPTRSIGYAPMGQAPAVAQAPTAEMGKSGSGCHRKRMGAKRGTRCFCNGKMVKSRRCK